MKQAWPTEGILLTATLLMTALRATWAEPDSLTANLSVLTPRKLLGV